MSSFPLGQDVRLFQLLVPDAVWLFHLLLLLFFVFRDLRYLLHM
jgi:hypothetical protein